jgi:hypothetical protein
VNDASANGSGGTGLRRHVTFWIFFPGLQHAGLLQHRGNEVDARGVPNPFGECAHDQTGATGHIQNRVVRAGFGQVQQELERRFIVDLRRGGEGLGLTGELFQRDLEWIRHYIGRRACFRPCDTSHVRSFCVFTMETLGVC